VAAWRAGAALAGCSAGACALTAVADDMDTGEARPGLDVVPGLVVLPHFDRIEQWAPGIVARKLGRLADGETLVGIDEETALVTAGDGWRVEGRRHVWLFGPDGSRTPYPARATPPLPAPAAGRACAP